MRFSSDFTLYAGPRNRAGKPVFYHRLRDESGRPLSGWSTVKTSRAAISRDQIRRLPLPSNQTAKETSRRYAKYVKRSGKKTWEPEAPPPAELRNIAERAIRAAIDIEGYNAEIEADKADTVQSLSCRERVLQVLGDEFDSIKVPPDRARRSRMLGDEEEESESVKPPWFLRRGAEEWRAGNGP